MTNYETLDWLIEHNPQAYSKAKEEAIKELDEQTPIFCFCGRLATGLHTMNCGKFRKKMETLIIAKNKEVIKNG